MQPNPTGDGPTVLIFRKRLLPWSETFIAAQGGALDRHHPVFVGYRLKPDGSHYLDGHDRAVLSEHSRLPWLGKGAFKAFGWIPGGWRRAMEAHRPALVHAHFGTNAAAAIPIVRRFGIPLIATFHGVDIATEARGGRRRRQRDRVFDAAARIIAVSEFIADRLRSDGCPQEKITVHPIGIDTDRFAPGAGADRAPARVLFVGRLVPKKGLIHLLRAMRPVQRRMPEAELHVVGDGPLRDSLERTARELDIRCRFLGVRSPEQVRESMRRASLLCAPGVVTSSGNAEGLPMTILEAQATGLPVVAFPSGGTAEGIADGETGLIAPPGDERTLADHILSLLTDPDRRARFSAAARDHVVEHFDLRGQTAKLERIYDEVRSTRPAGREAAGS